MSTCSASYEQLVTSKYTLGAGPIPPGLSPDANLADTFLSSPVYNFSHLFSGPQNKLAVDSTGSNPGFTAYGIWNGATEQDLLFLQRYQQMLFGGRIPMFQTDYSSMYGVAAGQFSWIFERFQWDAFDTDVNGNQQPQWAAYYTNTLSQRMYGAMAGLGHEIFVANQFSFSLDLTASGLMDVAVERAKYGNWRIGRPGIKWAPRLSIAHLCPDIPQLSITSLKSGIRQRLVQIRESAIRRWDSSTRST